MSAENPESFGSAELITEKLGAEPSHERVENGVYDRFHRLPRRRLV
jgi:hypothetical protein